MSSAINWSVAPGAAVLNSPYYQKYSVLNLSQITAGIVAVKTDLGTCLGSNESAEVIAYLSWLVRVAGLLA